MVKIVKSWLFHKWHCHDPHHRRDLHRPSTFVSRRPHRPRDGDASCPRHEPRPHGRKGQGGPRRQGHRGSPLPQNAMAGHGKDRLRISQKVRYNQDHWSIKHCFLMHFPFHSGTWRPTCQPTLAIISLEMALGETKTAIGKSPVVSMTSSISLDTDWEQQR